jgi:hypothetical protein
MATRQQTVRRDGAVLRKEKRNILSAQEQLKTLDARLGVNIGATRERVRLIALLNSQQPASSKDTNNKPAVKNNTKNKTKRLNKPKE